MIMEKYNPLNPYIATASGRLVHLINPVMEEIDIIDIAIALSKLCRFTGHTNVFYCPTEDQKILTDNLEWKNAGDLYESDLLLGFDEFPTELGSAGNKRRKFRPSLINFIQPIKSKVFRLELSDGSSIRCSEEHPWLVATKISRNQKWLTTKEIVHDLSLNRKRYLHKFFNVWNEEISKEAGWLSGMFDGEGFLSIKNRRGIQSAISQNPGLVSDTVKSLFTKFNIPFETFKTGSNRCEAYNITGGYRAILETLGRIRPHRLLNSFKLSLINGNFTKQLDGKDSPLEIINFYDEGEQWVVGIETSTHTYFCEGYAAHNSVAQHSSYVSDILPPEFKLWGLLHDASEAYLGDVSSPLKSLLPDYREIEYRMMTTIAMKFGLTLPMPDFVKRVDVSVLLNEIESLMPSGIDDWGISGSKMKGLVIRPLSWKDARHEFTYKFRELTRYPYSSIG